MSVTKEQIQATIAEDVIAFKALCKKVGLYVFQNGPNAMSVEESLSDELLDGIPEIIKDDALIISAGLYLLATADQQIKDTVWETAAELYPSL